MTKKKLYLSNSQVSTYLDCPRRWYLDKIAKIRPMYLSSALWFGSAIDSSLETYLENKDYKEAFLKAMNEFETNGKKRQLPKDLLFLRINAGDCDPNLIDQSKLDDFCKDLGIEPVEAKEFLEYCKKCRKAKKKLDDTEQRIFNYCGFLTLVEKGLLLLEKLTEWIDENVAEVVSTQQKIELTNENGDKFVGYLDFIVKMKDKKCEECNGRGFLEFYPQPADILESVPEDLQTDVESCETCNGTGKIHGRKLLIDLKTSSNPKLYYPEDAAEKSRQLGIYSEDTGIREVAYLVADKNIRQKHPRVRLSFIEGLITEEHLDQVFEEIEEVTQQIKEKLPKGEDSFEKNKDSCFRFGKCQYYDLCHNGKMTGLEKVK